MFETCEAFVIDVVLDVDFLNIGEKIDALENRPLWILRVFLAKCVLNMREPRV
jgi:hypothetical protein